MRAAFVFLAAAFAFDVDDSPTYDPEEQGITLMDEYATEDEFLAPRFLQELVNASNITIETPSDGSSIPVVPLLLGALGVAGAGGAFYMKGMGETTETFEYSYEEDEGFLDEEYEYDEEYFEEEYEEYE
jgi:hypothetical protein